MEQQIQFTLSVTAGKWVIARSIAENKDVKEALGNSKKLLLCGGTTVSAVAELLFNSPLRISGRITPRGTVTAARKSSTAHTLLIHEGKTYDMEESSGGETLLRKMGPGDIIITGANLIDCHGDAALMASSYGLGNRGKLLASIHTEGARVIIAAGIEKLSPVKISESIKRAGRKASYWSMGAAAGLVPLVGEVITEVEGIESLMGIKPVVIGRGGVNGAEGSTTFVASGEKDKLKVLINFIKWASKKSISGDQESLEECFRGTEGCKRHLACIYKSGKNF